MSYGKLQANLSGQSSESGNLATFTLSITSTVRRPNFQTPVLSQGATIWANVSDMVNLESVEHPQQHFMKINFLAFLVILAFTWLSYNTVHLRVLYGIIGMEAGGRKAGRARGLQLCDSVLSRPSY